MIHIATVHWGSSFFQDIQFKNISKNISEFNIWTFIERIKQSDDKKTGTCIISTEKAEW